MRFSFLTAIALILFAISITTEAQAKITAASYTCSQIVPCDSYGAFTSADWAKAGNACLQEAFGYTTSEGLIDDLAGLDGSNCLTTKPFSTNTSTEGQLLPQCCVMALQSEKCVLHCNLER